VLGAILAAPAFVRLRPAIETHEVTEKSEVFGCLCEGLATTGRFRPRPMISAMFEPAHLHQRSRDTG
jgi:hypothetical protein